MATTTEQMAIISHSNGVRGKSRSKPHSDTAEIRTVPQDASANSVGFRLCAGRKRVAYLRTASRYDPRAAMNAIVPSHSGGVRRKNRKRDLNPFASPQPH